MHEGRKHYRLLRTFLFDLAVNSIGFVQQLLLYAHGNGDTLYSQGLDRIAADNLAYLTRVRSVDKMRGSWENAEFFTAHQ